MLKNYTELASTLKDKFKDIKIWSEIEFNDEDIRRINELEIVTNVEKHSIQIKIESNHCIIPSQYVLYAICVKELALSVKEHLDIFEKIKHGKSQNEIGSLLTKQIFDFTDSDLDEYSKKLALQIFIDEDLNQGAKSIVNGKEGSYTIRGIKDFFTSIILKPINIPAASSDILGKFIYSLTENLDLYRYLEKRFISKIPYVTKDNKIKKFVKNVLSFLLQFDELKAIESTLVQNTEPSLVSIKDGEISLTSIFKKSSELLSEADLTQGDKIRFFKDPLYVNPHGEYIYLSTEWTDGTDSRLDLEMFKKLINKYYPDFNIEERQNFYYLLTASGNSINSFKQIPIKLESFQQKISNSGIQISPQILTRFISALLTKPFVLLTGLSGSGKTKLAQTFAMLICESDKQYCIVPVGADWTNREPLLGFANALNKDEYVKPENRVLDLIIAANNDSSKPYFLILDEMNLSHVERYFADFLSVMETEDGKICLHSNKEDVEKIPSKIKYPKNLFIIGTVNIDETTYMFSPKVLDRASVIEFRVTKDEMENYLEEIKPLDLKSLASAGAGMAEDFVNIAMDNLNDSSISEDNYKLLRSELLKFFEELKKTGAEFGYRSASEIIRFAKVLNKLNSGWEIQHIIDAAIMQKLLPKVHGSKRKLDSVLKTLIKLCLSDEVIDIDKFVLSELKSDYTGEEVKYPLSLEKIMRMYKNLMSNSFTSYAEA